MPSADGSSTVAYRYVANQAICASPWIQKSGSTVRTSPAASGG